MSWKGWWMVVRSMCIMHSIQRDAVDFGSGGIPSSERAVEWLEIHDASPLAQAQVSRFAGSGGAVEWHVTVCLKDSGQDSAGRLERAWLAVLDGAGLTPADTLIRRVFCSDAYNQRPALDRFEESHPGAFSCIGQTPLAGGKLAIWSHHLTDPRGPLESAGGGSCFSCTRGQLQHHWLSGLCDTTGGDAGTQTLRVLEKHDQWLAAHGMNLADHVVRTWWFLRDIDDDYQGMVEARRAVFSRHGLTEETHYIASTGIAGIHPDPAARLSLDSHAIRGLVTGQIEYPEAPEHLGRTDAYGVTFERAAAISYADRRHVFISGTASIDATGNIVHSGDVIRQLDRALENIAALLAAANAGFEDLAMILVYLRDPADGPMVEMALCQRLGKLPMILLHAAVCRPGWLVEIEGVAIVAAREPELPEF